MLFSSKESLEERVVRHLLPREQTVKALENILSDEHVEITLQGLYKALRSLIAQEVIIKRGAIYSLSAEWRTRTRDELGRSGDRFELAEHERVSFDLASLIHLDQQWKNIVLPLQEANPTLPTFLYDPHEIWIHLSESRKESEKLYFESFAKNKAYAFHAIGGATLHDKEVKKEIESDYMQVNVGVEYFPKTDYPTIFGDYIITTKISEHVATDIEKCYAESSNKAALESGLGKIGIEKKKVRLIIERNRKKAKKLRKKIAKDFYVPKALIDEFDLY